MKSNIIRTQHWNLFSVLTCYFLFFGTTLIAQETVVINEINYRNINKQENIKFVELYNYGGTSVNISGWHLSGGVNYTFPGGTTIGADKYLVVAQDKATCQSFFSITGVLGNISGNLSASGDDVILRDDSFIVIDEVDYESWKEWPNVRFDDYKEPQPIPQNPPGTNYMEDVTIKVSKSIQRINPELDGKHGGSWSAAFPTPKQQNANFSNNTSLPVVQSVSKSPDHPASNNAVRIKVDFDNHQLYSNILNVELEYQINNAGDYKVKSDGNYNSSFLTKQMLDDGNFAISGDSTANNGRYTAIIPASMHQNRSLIRYKIKVETTGGYVRYFPDPNHKEDNYSYYVYNGDAEFQDYNFDELDTMQNITIVTKSSITNEYIGTQDNNDQYDGDEFLGEGTLIHNGKIFDHINFRPRGKTRNNRVKPGIKFKLNKEKGLIVEDDCGDDYKEERDNLVLSGTWVNDAAAHGLVESLIYKILELTKGWFVYTDYVNLRIVDASTETGLHGDFWGLFLILEDNNGELLKEHDLPDGNIWTTYDPNGAARFVHVDYFGDYPGYNNPAPWITDTNLEGNNPETPDVNTVNREMLFGDWIGNEFWANGESNYYKKHSYREYHNPETNRWIGWCRDYDGAFGSGNNVPGISSINNANPNFNIRQPLNIPPSLEIEYKGELRSAFDLLLNDQQIEFLVESELEKIYDPSKVFDWTTLDHARWGQTYALGSVDAQFNWYKNTWFQARRNYLANNSVHGIKDNNIPNTPSINLTGSHAIDDLSFSNSNYSDPNGNPFKALEWRIGEWSGDTTNPFYDERCEPKYEIQTVWESGELTNFSNNYTFPADAQLKVGRTYLVRVRYKDSTNRWSHWSDPEQFISEEALNQNAHDLVINEIMYHPDDNCGSEFLEIYNNENFTINLTNYKFTNGIDFDFPDGATIASGAYLVLAQDSIDFVHKFGFSPFGDYSGNLNDNGEFIELKGPFRVIVDSLTYNNKDPWDEAPDEDGMSLELLNPSLDNTDPFNWFRSDETCGTPQAENSRICTGAAPTIVFNEINYNSDNENFDPGDWVELHNPTASTVDLSGWSFHDNKGDFIIPNGTIMGPGAYFVLVENDSLFTLLFPNVATSNYAGNFSFNLSGKGERISLFDQNKCLADVVIYDDKSPWPEEPDGDGPSLSLMSPHLDNALATSWESSGDVNSPNGTPGCPNNPVDCFDLCPFDPNKTEPGDCGCGVPDTDTDSDGVADCADNCPLDPNKTEPGICDCGLADTDSDSDGVPNCDDNCPSDPNKTQPGLCGCGTTDTDSDSDGVPNCTDNCPTDPNKILPGICGCGTPDLDTDFDGTFDCFDNCPNDPNKTQEGICGCGISDIDQNNNGICDTLEDPCSNITSDNFENNIGLWKIGGVDAARVASSFSPGGSYSMRIRDDSGSASSIFTNTLNLTLVESIKIVFDYQAIGFVSAQTFFLESSTDGGATYSVLNEWVSGSDFINHAVYSDSISIDNSQLSNASVFRFRSNGNTDANEIYLDNIKLKSCPNGCDNFLTQTNNSNINNSGEAIIGIETNGIVQSGNNISLNAGQYISMTSGFEVKPSAQFHAYIEACQ